MAEKKCEVFALLVLQILKLARVSGISLEAAAQVAMQQAFRGFVLEAEATRGRDARGSHGPAKRAEGEETGFEMRTQRDDALQKALGLLWGFDWHVRERVSAALLPGAKELLEAAGMTAAVSVRGSQRRLPQDSCTRRNMAPTALHRPRRASFSSATRVESKDWHGHGQSLRQPDHRAQTVVTVRSGRSGHLQVSPVTLLLHTPRRGP